MTTTVYQVPGEPGTPRVGTRAASAATNSSTPVFLVQIPAQGVWLGTLIAKSSNGNDRRAVGLIAVTWAQPSAGEPWALGASVLHAAYTAEVTAIALGTPTASGFLPVTVTLTAGNNGSVDVHWRQMADAVDFLIGKALAPLESVSAYTVVSGVVDSFSRADSASALGKAETGQTPTVTGTWGISSKQAYDVTGAGTDYAVWDSGLTDHETSATLAVLGGSPAVMAGWQDANNYYLLQSFGGNLRLQKFVAGAGSVVAGVPGTAAPVGSRISLGRKGTSLIVKLNGTLIATITETSLSGGTKGGIKAPDGSSAARWADLAVIGI